MVVYALGLILSACGQGPQGNTGQAGQNGKDGQSIVVLPPPMPSDIEQVVNDENTNRRALGQAPLTQGLTCYLYKVPNSTTAIVGASLTSVGSFLMTKDFNSTGSPLNILPSQLGSLYTTYFIVKCYGVMVVTDDAYYTLSVVSDDGANVYVDGTKLDNDGLHGTQSASIVKYLRRAVHSFELDFFQAGGAQGLQFQVNGSVFNSQGFYH